jgi:hypothetical protein
MNPTDKKNFGNYSGFFKRQNNLGQNYLPREVKRDKPVWNVF